MNERRRSPVVRVLGEDEWNRRVLARMARREGYEVAPLLDARETHGERLCDFDEALATARERLAEVGPTDVLLNYRDFPTSALLPLLAREAGTRAPSPEAVARCEHKYWSRTVQAAHVPDVTPAFQGFDPFDDEEVASIQVPRPYWIKPIKGAGSYLAFRIRQDADLEHALPRLREGIRNYGDPFDAFLAHVEVPPEIREVTGSHCIAEAEVRGRQCTLEGWVSGGEVGFHGLVDSFRAPNRSSFTRYQYPSRRPRSVRSHMEDCARRLVEALGFDDGAFNIEFFHDETRNRLHLLEVNPRISQSHAPLFEMVDGTPNFEVSCEVGRGRRPTLPEREGPYPMAAKFFLRHTGDARVLRAPSEEEVAAVEEQVPTAEVRLEAREGDVLSSAAFRQDSYSFRLGCVFVAGSNARQLRERFERCRDLLVYEFEERRDDREARDA